jgi:hypothetical protein
VDRFTRQRAGNNVATDDNAIHVGLMDFLEYRLKRREVGMNIVDGSDAHDEISLIAVTQMDVI